MFLTCCLKPADCKFFRLPRPKNIFISRLFASEFVVFFPLYFFSLFVGHIDMANILFLYPFPFFQSQLNVELNEESSQGTKLKFQNRINIDFLFDFNSSLILKLNLIHRKQKRKQRKEESKVCRKKMMTSNSCFFLDFILDSNNVMIMCNYNSNETSNFPFCLHLRLCVCMLANQVINLVASKIELKTYKKWILYVRVVYSIRYMNKSYNLQLNCRGYFATSAKISITKRE